MGEKLRSQLGPFARSPPALRHVVKIEVEHEPAALSFHDAAHFDHLGAHAAQPPVLLLYQRWDSDYAQRLFVSVDIVIVELIEEPGRVTPIGLAFAVEHFGRHHMSLHSNVTQLTMERVAKAARFLDQDDAVFALDQLPGQINDGAARTLGAMDGPAAGHPCHEHCAVKLDIERKVNHTWFGPKSFKDCRKMGNDVIFEFVLNHTSRIAPSGAVLEAYMTLTADRPTLPF